MSNREELANCVTCGCKKRAFYSMMTYRQLLDFLQSSLLHTSLNCPVHLINLFSSVIFLETLTFFTAVGWGSLDLLTPRLLLSGESSNVNVLLVSSVLPGEFIHL